MTPDRVVSLLLGVCILAGTASSVMRTLVVPRGLSSLLSRVVIGSVIGGFRALGKLSSSYRHRDAIRAWTAPLAIVLLLLSWLFLFMLGYGAVMYATSDLGARTSLREAGSSLFTLGFASTDRNALTLLDFLAAATGPIVIGLLVGFLPALYASFQRRETEVTLLHSRAGEPNWGPELLRRHAMVGTLGTLDSLWQVWERWAADVGESHTNFPILVQVRSARPERNWLIALLCVLDASAMHMSLCPSLPQGRARVVLRQGFVCLRELAESQGIPFDADPDPDGPIGVTAADFAEACAQLAAVGYVAERTPAEAYLHFRGWRVNYESIAYELAARIDAVPAPWSGPRRPPLPEMRGDTVVNRTPGGGASPVV